MLNIRQQANKDNAVEVVEKYTPGFTKNPMLKMGYKMKMSDCVKFPQAGIPSEEVPKLAEDLAALGL